MTNRPTYATAFDPMRLWSDFAIKSAEMLWSSGQVINSRVGRMASAGANPSAGDRREMLLMGSEKVKAACESAIAVATRLQSTHWQLVSRAWRQWFEQLGAIGPLMTSRSVGEMLGRQSRLLHSVARSAPTHARLSGDAARLASAALKPVHRASTANARRLARGAPKR